MILGKDTLSLKNTLITCFVLSISLSLPAHSAIVDHNDYLTDTESGLDWLDVTKSITRSYADISAQLGVDGQFEGWRYATGNEFNSLTSHWTNSVISTNDRVYHSGNGLSGLVGMLGVTVTEPNNQFRAVVGLISDQIQTERWYAVLFDQLCITCGMDSSIAHWGHGSDNFTAPDLGSFLVRSSDSVQIPEPSIAELLMIGFLLLLSVRMSKFIRADLHPFPY